MPTHSHRAKRRNSFIGPKHRAEFDCLESHSTSQVGSALDQFSAVGHISVFLRASNQAWQHFRRLGLLSMCIRKGPSSVCKHRLRLQRVIRVHISRFHSTSPTREKEVGVMNAEEFRKAAHAAIEESKCASSSLAMGPADQVTQSNILQCFVEQSTGAPQNSAWLPRPPAAPDSSRVTPTMVIYSTGYCLQNHSWFDTLAVT